MAIIKCPECGKDISDHAASCPQCGYVLKSDPSPIEKTMRETELGEVKKSAPLGIMFIFYGIACIIGGIFTIAFIVGIVFIFMGIGMFYLASRKFKGEQKGICPYCGHNVTVAVGDKVFKCPECNKKSTKQDNKLITIV